MELGNMIFGNSRGNYGVPRTDEWEFQIQKLFDAIDSGYNFYGMDFENNVFSIMPYWWGDCTCGKDMDENLALEKIIFCGEGHSAGCYYTEYQKIKDKNNYGIKKEERFRKIYLKPLYKKHGFDTECENWWHGCAIRCDCGYHDKCIQWENDHPHAKDCKLIKPNFEYKPIGFELSWYKYPLRDSYMNMNIDIKQFRNIINKCIESLREENNE